ncbi:MAG: hypothetical protein WCH61_10295, partial [bacterium]
GWGESGFARIAYGIDNLGLDTAYVTYAASMVALFRADDGGETVENFQVLRDWENDWGHAGVPHGYSDPNDIFTTGPEVDCRMDIDSDGDGMPDWWEVAYGLDPFVNDADLNPDGDLLINLEEYFAGTNPHRYDTNNDGIQDGVTAPYWPAATQYVTINPNSLYPADGGFVPVSGVISAEILSFAADTDPGDAIIYAYQWYKDGLPVAGQAGASLDLGLLHLTTSNVTLRVDVTPVDQFGVSGPTQSASVKTDVAMVGLTPPYVVSFTPTQSALSPTPTSTLTVTLRNTCIVPADLVVNWYKNHEYVSASTAVGVAANGTVALTKSGPFTIGDVWYFKVQAKTSTVASAWYNSLNYKTIGSRLIKAVAVTEVGPPSAPTATVALTWPGSYPRLTCTARGAVAPSGLPFNYYYQWYRLVGGSYTAIPGAIGTVLDNEVLTVLSAGEQNTNKGVFSVMTSGDAFFCRVYAMDQESRKSASVNSNIVGIPAPRNPNGGPGNITAAITPANPTTGDRLFCTVSGGSGTVSRFFFQWYLNNGAVVGKTTATLNQQLVAGNVWYCTVWAVDAYGQTSALATSNTVVVAPIV